MDQLGLQPVRVDLVGAALDDALCAALPGLHGAALARALIEVEQLLLGLTPQVNVEWSMPDNRTLRHYRARIARGGSDDANELFGFSREVTREVTASRRAQQRNAELEALIEALPEAVLLLESGKVVLANLAAHHLLQDGATPGSPFLGLVASTHRPQLAVHARVGEAPSPVTLPLDIPGGRFVEVFSADLPSRAGMRIVTLRDVTQRQWSELRAAAGDRLASVGRLAAGVAHEINNPLTYVSLNLEMLAEDLEALRPRPAQAEYECIKQKLDDALSGTQRVAEIVQQLRLFAHHRHQAEAVGRLSDAAAVATQLASFAIPSSVDIEVDLPPTLPAVTMSVGELSQVIMNMCVNAGDAIEDAGHPTGRVHISAHVEGTSVRMIVRDDGPGVPQNLHEAVFQPFFTTKEAGKGTGMGLSITRRLVHEAGGTVSLVAVPHGACFEVTLPIAHEIQTQADAPTVEVALPERRTLLVVDDEPALRRALSARLRRSFDVKTAADGLEAQALIKVGLRPAAILCDVEMPRVDGPTFLEWLRTDAPALLSRVIVITGGTLDPARAAWLEASGRPVLAKPLHMPTLQERLAEVSLSPDVEPMRSPTPSPAERRGGCRVAARGIRAVLDLGDGVHSADVIDMSANGLRLRNRGLPEHALAASPIRVLLVDDNDEPVSLSVSAVWTREHCGSSMEYGFVREPSSAPVPAVLARWIGRAQAQESPN